MCCLQLSCHLIPWYITSSAVCATSLICHCISHFYWLPKFDDIICTCYKLPCSIKSVPHGCTSIIQMFFFKTRLINSLISVSDYFYYKCLRHLSRVNLIKIINLFGCFGYQSLLKFYIRKFDALNCILV